MELREKLQQLRTAEKRLIDILIPLFIPKLFKKGLLLSMPDHSFPILYFIETGLVRGYFVSDEEENTAWIVQSGFLIPSAGFFATDSSIEYVSFLKESIGGALSLSRADQLAEEEPKLYRMMLEIYEGNLHAGKERELMLRIKLAENRYLYYKQRHPELIDLTIHDILASLLNIESKYLYRIKRKYR